MFVMWMCWNLKVLLVGGLGLDFGGGIMGMRLWSVIRRFFEIVVDIIVNDYVMLVEKLCKVSLYWMWYMYVIYVFVCGLELIIVCDNLCYVFILMILIYLYGDDVKWV